MRIALPVWDDRISPVFDTASSLLVVDAAGSEVSSRDTLSLQAIDLPGRAAQLASLGVAVLICGAISRPLASMVASYGITVLPFMSGDVEDVLAAYLTGQLSGPDVAARYRMPGCFRHRRGMRRQRGGF